MIFFDHDVAAAAAAALGLAAPAEGYPSARATGRGAAGRWAVIASEGRLGFANLSGENPGRPSVRRAGQWDGRERE